MIAMSDLTGIVHQNSAKGFEIFEQSGYGTEEDGKMRITGLTI